MLVEVLVAFLFLLVWLKLDVAGASRPLGLTPVHDWKLVPVYWLAVSGLVLGTFVDFEHLIIPDRVTIGGMVAGLILSLAVPSLHGETGPLAGLRWGLLGAAVGGGTLWATAIVGRMVFRKEAMGFGDVKLLAAIGAFLGSKAVFFTILASSLLGSAVGITLVLTRRKHMQSRIPYGPYLALGALVWILWGQRLWEAYMLVMRPSLVGAG
jgi:leader peptidase (prepilin peptidase)/N-methyltransferase